MLRLLAFAATVGIVIALLPSTVTDSGASAGYLLGVPVVAAVGPLVADLAGRAVGITTTVGALVMLVWGLLLGLGIGFWFIIPALLLGMAAVAGISSRRAAVPGNPGD
jgi:predicted histidine transporter YuiF (NhaC family)